MYVKIAASGGFWLSVGDLRMVENALSVGTASAVDSQQTRTVAAASLAASASAIRKWLESGGTEDLADLMSSAFDNLRAEFAA